MSKKTVLTGIFSLVLSFCLVFSVSAEASLKAGTYEATVDSVGGPLMVAVTVSEEKIENVEIKQITDTEGIYQPMAERLPGMIVEHQSINVDAVTGATLSSMFFKNAVKEALSQATDDLTPFQEAVHYAAPVQQDMDVDIVIVGAGMTGLSAALTAINNGYSVVLLEELAYVGGNAIPSDQYSLLTPGQCEQLIEDFTAFGTDIQYVDFWGGMMKRMFPGEGTNTSYMNGICLEMRQKAEEKGALVLTETPAIDLIIEDGVVKGVVAKPLNQNEFRITANATLLSCGGFQGNKAMVDEYLPFASGAMTIGPSKGLAQPFEWLKDFDLATRDMAWELAMFYSIDPANGHHAVWGIGDMNFLDDNGDLITTDHNYNSGSMETYKAVGNALFHNVWSRKNMVDINGEETAVLDEFERSSSVVVYSSLSALAEGSGLPNIKDTLTGLGYEEDDVYYYVPAARAGIYGTMGGIAVNENWQILEEDGSVIPGVFAAGETIGRTYGGSVGGATQSGYDAANAIVRVLSAE